MFLGRNRFLHTTRALRQLEIETAVLSTKSPSGKKKPPKKQNLIILNASQSKLQRKKKRRGILDSLSLTPEELRLQMRETSKILSAVPITDSTPDQIRQTINALKPQDKILSKIRATQLSEDISKMFTVQQLRNYARVEFPSIPMPHSLNKSELIGRIIVKCWEREISTAAVGSDELISQRNFDLTKKQMFFLFSQKSIIDNWMRANVKILVLIDSLQMIVRAPESHIQYIELALNRIFKNIKSEDVDLGKVKELFETANETVLLDDIQEMTGVFFEAKTNDEGETLPNEFVMSSLGGKKFDQVKRLILWSLDYNPFTKVNMHAETKNSKFKMFKHYPDNSLPWIHRKKSLMRLREPRNLLGLPAPVKLDSDKLYEELYGDDTKPIASGTDSVTAVSFGHILFEESTLNTPNPKVVVNTDIPFAHERIHKLPLYTFDGSEPDSTVDPHIYYAQIRLVPSPYNQSNNYMSFPPLEFWVETDQDNKARMDTFRVLAITNEINSSVSLPAHSTDVKFVRSDTKELVEPFTNSQENWMDDQPGVKKFLNDAVLDFSGKTAIKVPQSCDVILPGHTEPVRYDYVYMTHRKQVDLVFNDRILSYTVLEGGSLGGRTTEVIMVGKDEKMSKEEFKGFVKDCEEFIHSLEIH